VTVRPEASWTYQDKACISTVLLPWHCLKVPRDLKLKYCMFI
jgi:hypothetical protein